MRRDESDARRLLAAGLAVRLLGGMRPARTLHRALGREPLSLQGGRQPGLRHAGSRLSAASRALERPVLLPGGIPLAFPGVVIGFMVIMLAGRQGLIGDITQWLLGDKLVFAYSMAGLFMGYVYFSIPRTILTVMASAEKLDPKLEEAARSLGASPLRVVWDVIIPGLKPAFLDCALPSAEQANHSAS